MNDFSFSVGAYIVDTGQEIKSVNSHVFHSTDNMLVSHNS